MSAPINDGGPAFPYGQKNFTERSSEGMTLRDYFAGQALIGQLAFSPPDPFKKYRQPKEVAAACYRFADAMLAAREGKK
jgi:hypothetical protein